MRKNRMKLIQGEIEQLAHIYQHTRSVARINRAYGFSKRSRVVRNALRDLGVDVLVGKQKIFPKEEVEICKLYREGASSYELSDRYGIVFSAICALLERNGIERRDNRVLTDEQEEQVIKEYLSGKSIFAVGDMFGIDGTTVPLILRRHGYDTRDAGHNSRVYSLNEQAFDDLSQEEAAYWLGFIYADGCAREGHLRIALSINDIDHLRKFQEFIQCDHPIKKGKALSPQGKLNPTCQIDIYSNYIAKRLQHYGIVAGRNHFYLTEKNLTEQAHRHFIRGLVDGDGTLDSYKRNNARIRVLGQVDILKWVALCFSKNTGTNKNRHIQEKTGIHSLEYGGAKQSRKIIRWLYSDASVWLERKLDKMSDWW